MFIFWLTWFYVDVSLIHESVQLFVLISLHIDLESSAAIISPPDCVNVVVSPCLCCRLYQYTERGQRYFWSSLIKLLKSCAEVLVWNTLSSTRCFYVGNCKHFSSYLFISIYSRSIYTLIYHYYYYMIHISTLNYLYSFKFIQRQEH